MTTTKMTKISFRLPASWVSALDAIAAREGCERSKVIRNILKPHMTAAEASV
ncbi:metal-responsive CopG/Arc/MetJ family transcriptional regulator [Methanomicrobium sp. W14]|uniref:hypothetical protein n=1 Tax=Methanomicrobium sp. W14 TaxID=2817839 RepID=UPI001AE8669F|nr:hypothetical protein [Methanomicrobium sp. W14]MBP2132613.1 metal-responsive CopG/Arc/MetJ family transcriptional regulator [Methanomicrobium sp. W14]